MRILISGDRFWHCRELAAEIVRRLVLRYGTDIVLIHGGAPGVDQAFALVCREAGIAAEAHVADWKGLGNIAGPARNREMVNSGADLCIALHRTIFASSGTKDCVRQALAASIPVYLIENERGIPERIEADDARLV